MGRRKLYRTRIWLFSRPVCKLPWLWRHRIDIWNVWNPENHNYSRLKNLIFSREARPVTNLGHQEGRRVFREGPKFFEQCPIFLNYVQHIFQGGEKFLGGLRLPCSPLVQGPAWSYLHFEISVTIEHSKCCIATFPIAVMHLNRMNKRNQMQN